MQAIKYLEFFFGKCQISIEIYTPENSEDFLRHPYKKRHLKDVLRYLLPLEMCLK